jgi:sulfonate transport system ATP-binding protein
LNAIFPQVQAAAGTRSETAAPVLEVRSVSRTFQTDSGPVPALSDVSFSVQTGEFVTLVGPSGCGKSTLLRLIAGLDVPDSGEVLVENRTVTAPSLARGIVFQDHRLLPWLTVAQNIDLGMHKLSLSTAERRARIFELVALVGLQGFEDAFPYQLSGGMSQRAAIARSLAPKPRMLLLDEPLGALDSLTRAHMQAELLRIWEHESITMIMVTHDVEEAVFLSDRIIAMHPRPGRIAQTLGIDAAKPRDRGSAPFAALKSDLHAVLARVP